MREMKIGKNVRYVTDSLIFAFDAVKAWTPILSSATTRWRSPSGLWVYQNGRKTIWNGTVLLSILSVLWAYSLKLISGEEQNIENVNWSMKQLAMINE